MTFTRQDKTQICIIIFTQLRSEVGRSKFVVVVLFLLLFCLFVCFYLFVCVLLFFVGFCLFVCCFVFSSLFFLGGGGVAAMPDMGGFVVVAASMSI